MTEAAVNLGYYDQSQFIRDFKKYAGITPKQYLKRIELTAYNKFIFYMTKTSILLGIDVFAYIEGEESI